MGYEQFGDYLEKQKESFSIKFDEIEEIIGRKLPDSALKHVEWWSNSDSHPLMKIALSENWKSRKLNLNLKEIEFYKISEFESEFEKIKRFCLEELPSPDRNYREIALKKLLRKEKKLQQQNLIDHKLQKLHFLIWKKKSLFTIRKQRSI